MGWKRVKERVLMIGFQLKKRKEKILKELKNDHLIILIKS